MSEVRKRRLRAEVCFLATAAVAFLAGAGVASADTLVMPYSCALERGEPVLRASSETRYPLLGTRDEQALAVCNAGAQDCTTVMVHRFTTLCGGEKTAWARIAASGRALGIAMPSNLPPGYAPIGGFKGRLVLPALVRFEGRRESVASEMLSPDGVIARGGELEAAATTGSPWKTIVRAEFRTEPSYTALRVAGIASGLLALMLSACMIAAGRWNPLQWLPAGSADLLRRAGENLRFRAPDFQSRFPGLFGDGDPRARRYADPAVTNALAIATARLAEAELLIATLPRDLLLREVLQVEADTIRARLAGLEADIAGTPHAKSSAIIRAVLRDLERVARIANGAALDTNSHRSRNTFEMPDSPQQAYQMLGINADAPPHVAKKIVDGLRMSWHPDLARNEEDREMREARMKQINAAWDLIKDRRAAA